MVPRQIAVILAGLLAAYCLLPAKVRAADCVACEHGSNDCASCQGCAGAEWENSYWDLAPPPIVDGFGATLRTGLVFAAGSGFWEEHIDDPGWMIEATARQPTGFLNGRTQSFFEIGGSYIHNYTTDSLFSTSGTFVEMVPSVVPGLPPTEDPTFLDQFLLARLKHLQRGSMSVGVGATYLPCIGNVPDRRDVYLTWRGGMRFGHVHARFDQTPSPELQALIDDVEDNRPNSSFGLISDEVIVDTDTFFGLYTSAAVEFTSFPLPLDCFRTAEYRLAAEVVYDYSWIDLSVYGQGDSGVGTLSALLGLTFTW